MSRPISILLLLLLLLSLTPTLSLAKPINNTIKPTATRTVDGDPSDWTGTPPATDNTWTYDDVAHEWIWKDATGDTVNFFKWISDYKSYLVAIDDNYANDQTGANLTALHVAWDNDFLYINFNTSNSASWDVAYGIGLDIIPHAGYNNSVGTSDAWGRQITFDSTKYGIDYEIYLWWGGTAGLGSVEVWKYDTVNGWIRISVLGNENGTYYYIGDPTSNGLQSMWLAIPWTTFNLTSPPSGLNISVWVAGGDGSSAVDSVPDDPAVSDNIGGEWTDQDTFTTMASVTLNTTNKLASDSNVDLTEFRITGNSTHLLMLIRFSSLKVGIDGAPVIFITVDEDRSIGSGETYFAFYSDTQVAQNGEANWERQIAVDLASLDVTVYEVYDTTWTNVSSANTRLAASETYNCVEVAVAWSDLGYTTPPVNTMLRFEVAVARVNTAHRTWDILGVSNILDAITTTATWNETRDGYIDYYFDVWFNANSEPETPTTLLDFVEPPTPSTAEILHIGTSYTFEAQLTVAGAPIAGQAIWVYINGINDTALGGFTDSTGSYSLTLTPNTTLLGTLNITVYHPGNVTAGTEAVSATRVYTVKYETRIVNFALNVSSVTTGSWVRATGVLEYYDGATWQPLAGETVEIVLVNKSEVLATGTTQSDGSFTIDFQIYYVGDNWEIKAHYAPTTSYDESYSSSVYLDVKGLIDLSTNANDFPAGSLVYKANDVLVTPTGEPTKDNMSMLYIAWDTSYLYIGVDWAPEDWDLGLGIAIDVNPGNGSTGYGAVWAVNDNAWEDCWRRRINMSTPYLTTSPIYPELMVYLWYDHTSGITATQINRFKYESYPPIVDSSYGVQHWEVWEYNYASPEYSPVATSHDGSTLFKVAIPWSVIMNLPNITYTGKIAIAVWSTHGEGTSAMSVLPMNPTVFDKLGWDELGDTDIIYEFVEITYDQDLDGTPDTGVSAVDRAVFYPSITTSVETDQDTYTVGAGGAFTVKARVVDQYGYYLPVVKVELYDQNSVKVAEALTGYNDTGFYADLSAVAPTTKGVYTWTVKFIGEAGFTVSQKTITLNVTGLATKILLSWSYSDNDANNRVSSGDTITLSLTMLYFNPNTSTWEPLGGKTLDLSFSYSRAGITDTDTVTTLSDGTATYTYTVATVTGADVLTITVSFAGDATYAPTSNSTTIEINLARLIDGVNDWGTGLPRSTPGIAPRGDEIVITDPTGDINSNAKGTMYADLDIKEVRITYDGIYLYFYVKFADGLTSVGDYFTVNIVIDATPDNPYDGVDEWFYGIWFTDTKPGGFDPNTGTHIDHWKWTHIIEARPHDGWVDVRALSGTPTQTGEVAVNTADGFIEFKVPLSALPGLDPEAGFKAWITVFGVDTNNPGQYFSLPGSNVIDIAGVGATDAEVLTSRDPNWGNLVWPSEDIWVDQSFYLKFTGPGTPDIPEPDPTVPPTEIVIIYPPAGSIINVSSFDQYFFAVVLVRGTQGRPVTLTVPDVGTFTGVVGGDDVAIIPFRAPFNNGTYTITATSDGASDSIVLTVNVQYTLPMPEPPLMPLILLAAILAILLLKKRK